MQHRFDPSDATSGNHAHQWTTQAPADIIDVGSVIAAARRQLWVVLACVVLFLAAGSVYLLTAIPLYTANSTVLIDSGNSKLVDQLSAVGGMMEDEASILSQVELIKSDELALDVVDSLGLIDDPDFNADHGSVFSAVRNILNSLLDAGGWFADEATVASVDSRRQSAARRLTSGLTVSRVGRTYVLEIGYTSANAALAAKIADGYAEAYLTDQLDSKYEATRRASGWLQERIAELRQQSLASDLAIQQFRSDNGLIATGGELLSDQQLSQLTTQLIITQADTAQAQAKLRSIEDIIAAGDMDAVVTDALDMKVISDMRASYLQASREEADISGRLGSDHEAAVRLRQQMEEYRRLMFEELSRIAQSYRSTYQIAKAREDELRAQVLQATGVSVSANDSLVQLRELEREAESYRNLYQTFLQRYQEAVQQQSFPVTEARIISRATTPGGPSSPKLPITLALCAGLGMLVGGSIGGLREYRDRYFRTSEQVRSELELEFLGNVPLVRNDAVRPAKGGAAEHLEGYLQRTRSISGHVVDNPLSSFAEVMRGVKIAIDLRVKHKQPKVIGIVSVLPGEGKSTIAVNLAEYLAKQGSRTLLLDGDLRNPSSTRVLAPNAERGLAEVLLEGADMASLLLRDQETGLSFLPTVATRRVPYSAELLSSSAMDEVLLNAVADYVVIDLPPLGPVVDARAMVSKVDVFVLVVEWGKTPRRLVRSTLQTEWMIAEKCVGTILNKVDTHKLKLYDSDGSSSYYSGRSAYYVEQS